MGSVSLDDLTPDTRERVRALLRRASEKGIKTSIASTRRSCADQASIYAQGRTAEGAVVTHAQGCRSWHTWGRAVDLVVLDDGGKPVWNANDPRYDVLGELGESLGLVWGGRFSWGKDAGHFEFHPKVTISEICPDPVNCEAAVTKPWPGPIEPFSPPYASSDPDRDAVADLFATRPPSPSGSWLGTVAVGLAVIGACLLAWQAFGKDTQPWAS